ncbi:hypothetical protein GCM10027515_33420 [Schumannella luteola]|uniref:LPXTG cell wall anchor domain-containing protein n=1 Tax=Schumannella luteola TaxID=472059 RepID=A0A852YHT5_9MICO|nr:hypothetical protein [Schumannella luteola]NYH00702.1 hypothetical protein [Schumannella luteola]TPX01559.1 hypothetical protein FJ656_26975 [Schumannella luteola]
MKKTTTGLLGLGVATVLALSPLGATIALADGDTPADTTTNTTSNSSASTTTTDSSDTTTTPTPDTSSGQSGSTPPASNSGDEAPPAGGVTDPNAGGSTGAGNTDPGDAGTGTQPPTSNEQDPVVNAPEKAPSRPGYVYGYWSADGPTLWAQWLTPAESGSSPLAEYHVTITDRADASDAQTVTVPADAPAGSLWWNGAPFTVAAGYDKVWDISVTAENEQGLVSEVATGTGFSPESPRPPSAPLGVEGAYSVDDEGSASVTVNWSQPDDWGVTDGDIHPTFTSIDMSRDLYRVTLDSGDGLPQVAIVPARQLIPVARGAIFGSSYTFSVARGYDQTWDVSVEASNDGGATWGDAGTGTVSSPDGVTVSITSATTSGYRVPTVSVSWDATADERVSSWLVAVINPAAQNSGDAFYSVVRVPAGATSATLRGGESVDVFDETLGGRSLPNSTELYVLVLAEDENSDVLGSSDVATVTTLSYAPPAPVEPTAASTGGVTASVTGTTITAVIPGAKPGQWVYGWAFSSPVGLGWTQVSDAGTASWSIAAAGLANGTHHLAVLDESGALVGSAAFTVGVAPAAVTTAQLASTGADASAPLGAAALLVLAGVTLVALRRVRTVRSHG